MEESILTSTKKILGIAEEYEAFDLDIIMYINSSLSVLRQLGIGPELGFTIQDKDKTWEDFLGADASNWYVMVKTYVGLKVRTMFDPPQTGFLSDSLDRQIAEHEGRLSMFRDEAVAT